MSSPINRRAALGTIAASCAAASAQTPSVRSSLLQRENERPGTRDWMLTKTRVDPSTKYRCPWVEGYASHASIAANETLRLMISTAAETNVLVEVYRLGYYGGDGARLVAQHGPIRSRTQPTPQPGEYRLMNCQWETSLEFPIPPDWMSGVYVAKLTEEKESIQSYIIFIVRDDRAADLVFQCSDNTWQAYNRWPSQFSLYDNGKTEWHWGGASQVSYNRPYGKYCQIFDAPLSIGSGEFFLWEFPFVYWLEREGYDVTYVSNTDTHRSFPTIARGKGFLSVGHDEYWTLEMFRNVQQLVADGKGVGFFSGNAVCGRVVWDEATRSIRRIGVFGPAGGIGEFEAMSTLLHERPFANELIGAHSTGPVTGGADWICTYPEHWIYEGTGMKKGDAIPGLIGWEYHGDPAPIPGLEVVATGPIQTAPGKLNGGVYTATVYPGPRENIVFNASTCWWADGLSAPPGYINPKVYTEPRGVDERVQQITRNVLSRMVR